ncbi:S8 family serine peptidase [Paenibacillus sp. NFR01]|uniref:S8 family serine peptidase n=1 Tax=Paenibacillus sp. NFR01 TaxID=1566279 RepID=UPI0008AE2C5F|nr:S8 family serine peptidase [Paenibacillus sp. NFR01]SEU27606.1 pre-peptidase C-terminal domain-containing protein [Paenibacillus sp. NFR01]
MKRKVAKRSFAMMLSASLALGLFPSALLAEAEPNVAPVDEAPLLQNSFMATEKPGKLPAGQRIIVKYKPSADYARLQAVTSAVYSESLSRLHMGVLELAPGADANAVLANLNSNPDVLYAEPDVKILKHASAPPKQEGVSSTGQGSVPDAGTAFEAGQPKVDSVSPKAELGATVSAAAIPTYPDDEYFSSQWGLHYEGQSIDGSYGNYDVDIDAPEAWSITKGSQDTIVAILDTGIDINHPDLAANVWRNPNEIPGNLIDDDGNGFIDDFTGWNFYGNNSEPYSIYDDDFYGTQTAGILAAKDNNFTGISGVAPGIRYMPLKIMGADGGYVSDALRAIDYAERMGAKIANISWSTESYSNALKDAIDASDMLFVASAGEDYVNINKDEFPEYPAAYDSDNILSVAGLGMDGQFYNTYGIKNVDISAPSSKIMTTIPTRNPGVGAEIDNGTYKVIYNEMGYEGMWTGDASSINNHMGGFNKALEYLGKSDESPSSILLVDDEEISEQSDYSVLGEYKGLLNAAGANYDIAKVQPGTDGPSLEEMSAYDIVIWFTGYAFGSSLDGRPTTVLRSLDQNNLTEYLNGGGRLLLTGPGALTNIESSDFVKNVLHLDFVRYDFYRGTGDISRWSHAEGQPGTVYDGDLYDISAITFADYTSNDESVARMNLTVPMPDYDYDFGTYLAPAYASGVAALILSQSPTLDAKSLKERVILSGKHLESLYDEDRHDYMNNGRMVDAFRAVSDDDVPGKPLQAVQTDSLDQISGDMQDVFYVHLNAGDKLNLSLTGDNGGKFMMVLYNPDLKSLSDWDAQDKSLGSSMAGSSPATLTYQADKSGYYYVGVFFIGSSDSYTLTMNTDPSNMQGMYEDTSASLAFTGPWAEKEDEGYSGGTVKTIDAAGSVKLAFTGSQIEWTALKDDSMGIADVYLDGVKAASPSLYSKTPQAQQSVFKQSLQYGYHTIEVKWTGKSDPAAKRTVHAINVDSFNVGDGAGAFTSVKEESDAAFLFNGIWAWQSNVNYSGGHAMVTENAGAYAEFSFTGTNAVLQAATSPKSGKVTIMIDDQPETAQTIDLYSEATHYQVPVFDTGELSYGPHLLRIINVHAKNEKSGGYSTNVDAIVVTKPADGASLKIYQDMNPFVKFTGVWTTQISSKNSGGSAKYSDLTGNAVKFTFLGTKVTLLSQTGPTRGMVDIYIDGVKANEQPIDMYSEQYSYKVPVFESAVLPYGSHEVQVVNTGEKNVLSSGHVISIDAFYVIK